MKKTIYILATILLFASCSNGDDKKKKLAEMKVKLTTLKADIDKLQVEIDKENGIKDLVSIPVEVVTITPIIFNNYVEVMGKVDADENIMLSSEMIGTITKISVTPGDAVTKGQVLAETDNKAMLEGLEDLKTNQELVNTLFDKQKSLWDQKIGTEVQFLQIKNQKESLAKKVNSIQEQLKMTKIISPINGIVDAVDVKLGQAIAPGFPAIRVINMSSLRVKAEVAESYAARIKKGTDVTIYFPDINDSIQSKVTYASRSINLLSRTFNVEVKLENTKECHPNMYARLKIKDYQSETPVIVIPVKLIQHDKTEEFVMVNASGKSERRTVKTGKSYNGLFEIVNGLKAGDQIITNGYFGLPVGETLNILEK